MSRQVMVALPAWVRRRLGVQPGGVVYFHRHRGGEVVLSPKLQRSAGQPGRRDLEDELAALTVECAEWKRQALGAQHGDYREGHAHGYGAAIREYGSVADRQDAALTVLREVRALVRQLATPAPERRAGAGLALPPGVVAIDLDEPDTGDEPAPASTDAPPPAPSPSS